MKIEKLNEGDYTRVSKLLVGYWKKIGKKASLSEAETYLLENTSKIFVAKDNEIIGFISLYLTGDLAEIKDFVSSNNDGSWALIEFILDYAKTNGIRKLFSLVSQSDKEFYLKNKFIEEGHLRDHFRDGEDIFYMSLKFTREKQVDLKSQLEKLDVEKKVEEKLLNLPLN